MDLLSIENFDPDSTEPPYLTSPRSLEACRRTGIDPAELLRRPREIYLRGKVTQLERDVAKQTFLHDEQRRLEKIQTVKDARLEVMEERKNRPAAGSAQLKASEQDSSVLEREKLELARLSRKQELEILQMVEFEKKQASVRMRNQAKDQQLRQKELSRLRDLLKKQKELEILKQKDAERRNRIQRDEENRVKRLEIEEIEKSRKRQHEEEAKEREKTRENQARDKSRALKAAELRQNTEKILLEQQKRFEERRKLMATRETNRVKMMAEARKRRTAEIEQAKGVKQRKLATAQMNLAVLSEEQRKRFEEKQRESEIKRKVMEAAREQRVEALKRAGVEKQKKIQTVARENKQKDETRYRIYEENVSKAELLQVQLEHQKSLSLRQKLLREQEKALHIQQVRDRMQAIETDRIGKIVKLQSEKEMAISKAREGQVYRETLKRNEKELRRRDKLEAVHRMGRVQEYEKLQVLKKMNRDAQRTKEIQ